MVTYSHATMEEMEPIFRALADPNRRYLLDLLHERDGQTLLELQGHLPMTRFGVMKHLKILEEAGLVVTRRQGREKLHFLNRIPIQLVYDRWVSKYSKPWARSLTGLKYALEEPAMSETVSHYFEVYIRSTPEKIWQAITDGAQTQQYYFGTAVDSTWTQGAPFRYMTPDGKAMLEGTITEIDPPKKLVHSFQSNWDEASSSAAPSTVTYEIVQLGDTCKLTLLHEGLAAGSGQAEGTLHGWSQILSSMKSLLETGKPLSLPPM